MKFRYLMESLYRSTPEGLRCDKLFPQPSTSWMRKVCTEIQRVRKKRKRSVPVPSWREQRRRRFALAGKKFPKEVRRHVRNIRKTRKRGKRRAGKEESIPPLCGGLLFFVWSAAIHRRFCFVFCAAQSGKPNQSAP